MARDNIQDHRMTDEERQQYEKLQHTLSQIWGTLVMLDRLSADLNPRHQRRYYAQHELTESQPS